MLTFLGLEATHYNAGLGNSEDEEEGSLREEVRMILIDDLLQSMLRKESRRYTRTIETKTALPVNAIFIAGHGLGDNYHSRH
jgi:hypothetical protein